MYPQTNSWTNYQFTGDVTGASKTSGKWTFTVYGEITAENQKLLIFCRNLSINSKCPFTGSFRSAGNITGKLIIGPTIRLWIHSSK